MKLSDLKPNQKGIVTEVVGNSEIKRRLLNMGVVRGVEIRMVRNAPLRDPIEFEVRGYLLSLRRDEAENVIVEVRG